jgi:hypothetical protein
MALTQPAIRHAIAAAVIALLCASAAPAQTMTEAGPGVATSFEQLRVLARSGDTVTLTDASFSPVSGRIDTLTSSTLSLVVNGIRRNFEPSDVTAIWASWVAWASAEALWPPRPAVSR